MDLVNHIRSRSRPWGGSRSEGRTSVRVHRRPLRLRRLEPDLLGLPVDDHEVVGEVAAGPDALVTGVAARTGAQATASFLAAAAMAASAFCIGAASGMVTVPDGEVPPRAPVLDPVAPV